MVLMRDGGHHVVQKWPHTIRVGPSLSGGSVARNAAQLKPGVCGLFAVGVLRNTGKRCCEQVGLRLLESED